jgi:hypothetical protein
VFAFAGAFVFVLASTGAAGCSVFAAGSSVFVFAAGGVVSVEGDSEVVDKTEMSPVRAGIASNKAEIIKTVAATIVIFDKTVAVPRGPKAALETLLVKSAPASVFPG